jgi:hypothetical protein
MKLLILLILCSCAQTPQRFIRTTTTTIKRHYPAATQTVKVEQSNDHSDLSDVEAEDYDFTEIDREIEDEDRAIEALPASTLDSDMDRFEGEVTLGNTRIMR